MKNTPRDHPKPTGRHRFRDISPTKLMDLIKSLRHRCLRRSISHRSTTLTRSYAFSLPFADHESSHVSFHHDCPSISESPSFHIPRYPSNARRISRVTQEDRSAGLSTSTPNLKTDLANASVTVGVRRHFSPQAISALPTTPSTFQLRSTSGKDYLVEQLENQLSRMNLGDVSLEHLSSFSRDIPMDVCPPSEVAVDGGTSKPLASFSHDQDIIPMILITSVDSVHAKPLPHSNQRSSITPFGQSNIINYATNISSTKSNKEASSDDPFVTQPTHTATYPPDYNLTFRVPPFPLAHSISYAPETPTPMLCDHFGDCSGDLWDIWHPPLVASRFTLPPFTFPPLSSDLFDGASVNIPVSC
ncbi:hypothetical protein JVU11DRAFT_7654 [Chiua virens]|nr:hypothetical protein JVU11DRAFT_7654 [Chiua virens]